MGSSHCPGLGLAAMHTRNSNVGSATLDLNAWPASRAADGRW